MRAYLDTSAVNHLYSRLDNGEALAFTIAGALVCGELEVVGSMVVSEELIQTAEKNRPRALALGALYTGMIQRGRVVGDLPGLIVDAACAYAAGAPAPSPYRALTPSMMTAWADLMTCRAPAAVIDGIVGEAREEVNREFHRMRTLASRGATARTARSASVIPDPTFEDLWMEAAPYYALAWATRAGVADRCWELGIEGLLEYRPILAAVGFEVVQMHAQSIEGKGPERGDRKDFEHVVSAAAAADVFVTEDRTLRDRVNAIPGDSLDAINLTDVVARLRLKGYP